jgi:Photosynthetic reaction centre cytochrome C subunit
MPRRIAAAVLMFIVLSMASLSRSEAQGQPPAQGAPPWKAKNLEFFPKDISRADLTQKMREFSFALGVRCQHCHVGGDGISFDGVIFDSDEKPAKRAARAMLRMVDQINSTALPQLPAEARAEPRVVVECVTCHRGVSVPKSLQTTLFEIIQKDGTAAAMAKYRELRADAVLGRYNFGEWEINELSRRLSQADKPHEAIAMLEMNREFYPEAAEIDVFIGEQYLKLGERDKALERYHAALAKAPQNDQIKQRLAALEKPPAQGTDKAKASDKAPEKGSGKTPPE